MPKQPDIADNALWKQRFRLPTVLYTQIAVRQPSHGLAVSNRSGKYQIYSWDVSTGELCQLSDRSDGLLLAQISPDARYIYYLDDKQGNEIGHFVRIPYEGGQPQDITPDLPPYSSHSFEFSQSGNRMGFTAASSEGFQHYVIDINADGSIGMPKLYHRATALSSIAVLSYAGDIVVVATTEGSEKLQFRLFAFDAATGEKINELWDGEGTNLAASKFSPLPGDDRLLGTTNRSGVMRPLIWNPRTGERIDIELAELAGEVHAWDWSPDARKILICQFNRAVQQLYLYEIATKTLTRLHHPSGSYGATYFTPAGEIFATQTDSTHPQRTLALDGSTGEMKRTALAAGDAPASRPWRSVSFQSSDGTLLQAWLGTPEGNGPFPTILHMIGGPTGVATEGFDPASQMWLDHGFAYMSLNYRGCSTFGRDFQEKIYGDLGHWEVEDIAAAHDYLVREGIATPDQILLNGWSYGGYLTLLSLGKKPDLWAGGLAGIAIADWLLMYEDEADTLRGFQKSLFGGTPDEKREQHKISSPITYAENVKAPVLIIQGRNDTRTPARQLEAYETRMKALGKLIEVEWFESGHLGTLADVELGIKHHERMLNFAYRILG